MEKRYKTEIVAFGKRLRLMRKTKRLSQLDIEISTGINRTEVSRIENGLKNIEFVTMVRLAVALDIEIIDFFKK